MSFLITRLPGISIEKSKGLSNELLQQLKNKLDAKAVSAKGEVMIFELAQIVEGFLHEYNFAPRGSFYEEMVSSNLEKEMNILKTKQSEVERKRKVISDEVQRRRQELNLQSALEENINYNSNINQSNYEHADSYDESKYFKSSDAARCTEHHKTEVLYFPVAGKKIQKGSCLNHSEDGYISFSGIDLENGQLVYVTEWNIKLTTLQNRMITPDEAISCK